MNRNVNSRFALNPTNIDMPRSRFNRTQDVKLTFNVGDIIPFYVDEVLPGDTFKVSTSKVVRLQTLVTPMMDNLYLDTYYFFVPNRLVWEHWKEFMGENTASAWIPSQEYSVPKITAPGPNGWSIGTIADYMGIPTGIPGAGVNALPFRAYALICDQWFRSENLTDPLNIPLTDSTVTGSNGTDYINDVAKGGMPFKAAKYFDYFTGALPAPQKGPDVALNLAQMPGQVPVYGNGNALPFIDGTENNPLNPAEWKYMRSNSGSNTIGRSLAGASNDIPLAGITEYGFSNSTANIIYGVAPQGQYTDAQGNTVVMNKAGLYADLESIATDPLITINQLRQAFQIQKFYEKSARGGTRYIELIKSMFGVTSPDSRLQRSEYLGGNRIPINVNQVIQTSETSTTPLGDTAAYSLTSDSHNDFTQSFTEHGFVIGLMVARYDHTYQQGLEKFWSRKSKFDYYWPLFANLGEQAIKNKEIYLQEDTVVNQSTGVAYNEEVFGYQEAWADYRYKPNRVCGEMRSSASASLDMWHLADDYNALPSLSDGWIREDKTNVDRVLAVTSAVSNQLFADIYIKNVSTRAMPVYSIPGLIDHH